MHARLPPPTSLTLSTHNIHTHFNARTPASYSVLVVDPEFVRQIVTGPADLFPKGHL